MEKSMSKKLTLLAFVAILFCSAESYASAEPKPIDVEKCKANGYSASECAKKKMVRDAEIARFHAAKK
jgi:hypothetical protein